MLPTKSRARMRVAAAVATAVALAAGALAVQQMIPASAASSAASSAPSTPVFRAPANLVQGVVVDQAGRPVDGLTVEAVAADGTTEASDLTYASRREDGPQHGYFYLFVPRGSYTLVISGQGFRTAEHEAGRITKRRTTISTGEVEVQKIAAPTTTTAALGRPTITAKDKGSVLVTVSSRAVGKDHGKVGGAVEVREGRTVVGEATIGRSAQGEVTVTLGRLPKGDHVLAAYFLGTVDHRASSSKQLTLHVARTKR